MYILNILAMCLNTISRELENHKVVESDKC